MIFQIHFMSQSSGHNPEVNFVPCVGDWAIRTGEIDILAPGKTTINFG